jgi:hypothetical protein
MDFLDPGVTQHEPLTPVQTIQFYNALERSGIPTPTSFAKYGWMEMVSGCIDNVAYWRYVNLKPGEESEGDEVGIGRVKEELEEQLAYLGV